MNYTITCKSVINLQVKGWSQTSLCVAVQNFKNEKEIHVYECSQGEKHTVGETWYMEQNRRNSAGVIGN